MNDIEGFFRRATDRLVLTSKEVEVAGLVALGWDNAEVARQLSVSVKMVEQHLVTIYSKMRGRFDCSGRHMRSYLGVLHRELCEKEAK